MGYLRPWALCAGAALVLAFSSSSPAAEEEEMIADRIHSILPLYTFAWADTWPRGFSSDDDFGCTSRVAFGDWRFTPNPRDEYGDEYWRRFDNYGVFHCAAILRTADERSELKEARGDYGLFVRIGKARKGGAEWELWAIQKGMVPGSDYVLLAREPGDAKIERFTVLQQRCPSGQRREVKGLDIWTTRYCAIDSRSELLSLARRMLALPALGVIERVEAVEETDKTG